MKLITRNDEKVISFFNSMNRIYESLKKLEEIKPLFNGERYLTDKQLSQKLNISRRTLQDYRTKGMLSYIMIGGKVLYKESDIQKMLDNAYLKAWKENNI
ncbi:helix-turn-helix domain-containing protein [Dysgonomonas sp. ZJ709]|uniref:helix-turn-helix domain-containing protein n=1 Tax=Dysgonomonas sp. ZJ709 TaxID=2709797 RepID=UPI0013EDCE0F|nr:helix-turn-helix domain-containing protein [Dysgonomonas sp. ZJ709]